MARRIGDNRGRPRTGSSVVYISTRISRKAYEKLLYRAGQSNLSVYEFLRKLVEESLQ